MITNESRFLSAIAKIAGHAAECNSQAIPAGIVYVSSPKWEQLAAFFIEPPHCLDIKQAGHVTVLGVRVQQAFAAIE